jgi:hypothetical protein
MALLCIDINLYAQEKNVLLNEDNEYIFEAKLSTGYLIEQLYIVHYANDIWYLPLVQTAQMFGIKALFSEQLQKVEGSYEQTQFYFNINVKECTATFQKTEFSFDCSHIVQFANDVYVTADLLLKLLPLELEIKQFKSKAEFVMLQDLPLKQKLDRKRKKVSGINMSGGKGDFGFPTVRDKKRSIDGFFGIRPLIIIISEAEKKYQTAVSFQIFDFESSIKASGIDNEYETDYINFKNIKAEEKYQGQLKPNKTELYHFIFPSEILVGGNKQIKGAKITNTPVNSPLNFYQRDFEGDLKNGWEVELFHNDILIAKEEDSNTGRYHFKNIDLFYGMNRFKLVFYGPQGEIEYQYKTFKIDQNILNKCIINSQFSSYCRPVQ